MNIFKYLSRQLKRFQIDILTQKRFLAGGIASIDDANIIKTVSTNYEELQIMFFDQFKLKQTDVIVDVGCGKGRVFSYLLFKKLKNKMLGYEINQEVGEKTKKRLTGFKNVEIICGNIFDGFPAEGNIFYLYNPFKEVMMTEFKQRFLEIADRAPVMIYNNPIHLDVFDKEIFDVQYFDIPVVEYNYNFTFAIIKIK